MDVRNENSNCSVCQKETKILVNKFRHEKKIRSFCCVFSLMKELEFSVESSVITPSFRNPAYFVMIQQTPVIRIHSFTKLRKKVDFVATEI